jgi:hypothetical protein
VEVNNTYALCGFIFLTAGVLLELSVIPKMVREVRRPRDPWTRMRYYALARLVVYVTTFSPFLLLLLLRIDTPPPTKLGAWIQLSVPFGLMCLALFTYKTYTYKEKE